MDTAPPANQKFTALITAVDSYLGREIAGLLTALNFEVYATGHGKTPSNLIAKKNFYSTNFFYVFEKASNFSEQS